MGLAIAGAVAALSLFWLMVTYNRLIGLRHHIRNAWATIDTELRRRYDLIPNLTSTVAAYAEHERAVLEEITRLRGQAVANTGSPSRQSGDERALVAGLQRLLAVVEDYPRLRADEHFARLHTELVQTEDRIQAARRFYNGNVRDYRTACESFPSNLVASLFGFRPEEYFSVQPSVREVPDTAF